MLDGSDLVNYRTIELYTTDGSVIKTDVTDVTFADSAVAIDHSNSVEVVLEHAIERYKLIE